ncbi:hypothetical protein KEM52_003555 [Ascosphaera acerosa]|nr:hypothetical protein KEM52_003555 [Ascosphaera acerosa]
MVEGSRIDHAGHGNDPAAQVHEVLAYDRAFAAVLDWIANEADPAVPTLLVSTSDHETGGLSVARQLTEVYPEYRWYPEVLAKAKHSSEFLAARVEEIIEEAVGDGDAAAVDSVLLDPSVRAHIKRELIEEGLGITDVSEEELDALVASYQDVNTPPNLVLADIISRRAQIGWSSHGHSAVDVNIYASSADAAAPLRGNHENTEVGQFLADYLAVDTAAVTDKLRGMRTRGGAGSGDGAVDEYAWLGPALDSDYRVDALDHYHGEFKRRRRHLHGGGCECGN